MFKGRYYATEECFSAKKRYFELARSLKGLSRRLLEKLGNKRDAKTERERMCRYRWGGAGECSCG